MQDWSSSGQASSRSTQQTKQGKWLFTALVLLCFTALAVLLFLSGDVGSQTYKQEALLLTQNSTVQVTPVKMQERYERKRTVYGQVETAKRANIGFDISGAIATVNVAEGEYVRAGQVLASLDLERLLSQEKELNAQRSRVLSERRLAELSAKRVADLVARRLEPQQNLDQVQANLDAATAQVAEVEAMLNSLQLEKEKSVLKAPFDGQVIAQLTDQGTVLNAGQAVFTIITDEILEARFGLPSDIAFGLRLGDQKQIKVGEGNDTHLVNATVISVAKQRNLATRTIDVVLAIEPEAQAAKSGNSETNTLQHGSSVIEGDLVSIDVGIEVQTKGAWLPLSALSSGIRGLWSVLVVDQNNQKLEVRVVAVEQLEKTRVYVSGAIRHDELVVVNGTHRLVPGQKVQKLEHLEYFDQLQQHKQADFHQINAHQINAHQIDAKQINLVHDNQSRQLSLD